MSSPAPPPSQDKNVSPDIEQLLNLLRQFVARQQQEPQSQSSKQPLAKHPIQPSSQPTSQPSSQSSTQPSIELSPPQSPSKEDPPVASSSSESPTNEPTTKVCIVYLVAFVVVCRLKNRVRNLRTPYHLTTAAISFMLELFSSLFSLHLICLISRRLSLQAKLRRHPKHLNLRLNSRLVSLQVNHPHSRQSS